MCRSSAFVIVAAVVSLMLAACEKRGNWPEGMEPIRWDRDTCAQCNMAISDPRFAVELLREKPNKGVFKFDDIGCLVAWTEVLGKRTGSRPWWEMPGEESGVRVWVADFSSPPDNRDAMRWLDARTARYIERSSPMGHNLAAVENSGENSVGFDEVLMRAQAHRHDGKHGDGQ
ncbi:MAG: nitrous oxide reductase accessory protein NosL [Azoarcus sp.]|jgi:nitrous oxide reductase accessory protein NosL|nr:nitrous oxide reductase accessory protein NosL [Azoarcus sp.]